MDSIDFWSVRIRDLEHQIVAAREAALARPPTTSYFVFFNSQKDAAIAAQTNLHAEDGHSFRVIEAPGPEEVTTLFHLLILAYCEWHSRRKQPGRGFSMLVLHHNACLAYSTTASICQFSAINPSFLLSCASDVVCSHVRCEWLPPAVCTTATLALCIQS